jgi:hypothetical protein
MIFKKEKFMRIALVSLLISIASYASSAEFFVLPGTSTLLVLGETKVSDVEDFQRYISDEQIDSIILNGPGGNLEAGYAIAEIVLEHGLATTVPENTDCASACSIIFSAGRERVMENGSRLGFHLPFISLSPSDVADYCEALIGLDDPTYAGRFGAMRFLENLDSDPDCLMLTYQMGLRDMRRLSKYLVRDGISEDVLDLVINTQSSDMTWVNVPQAIRYGLVNSNQ